MRLAALVAALYPAAALRLTRRALVPAATALITTKPAFADEEADVKPKRVQYGPGTVEVPSTWKIDGESISESILGTITTSVRARSAAGRPRTDQSLSLLITMISRRSRGLRNFSAHDPPHRCRMSMWGEARAVETRDGPGSSRARQVYTYLSESASYCRV